MTGRRRAEPGTRKCIPDKAECTLYTGSGVWRGHSCGPRGALLRVTPNHGANKAECTLHTGQGVWWGALLTWIGLGSGWAGAGMATASGIARGQLLSWITAWTTAAGEDNTNPGF